MLMATLQKPLLGVALARALLLLVPAVAMQFTFEVSWGPGDFIVAGILLFGADTASVLAHRHVKATGRRVALIFAVAFALAMLWAELAIGLFP